MESKTTIPIWQLYIAGCICALFFLLAPAKFPADDGFFYPQIAYHIVHGNGSYFNNLYLTNGYHPLWMLVCVFAELINPFGKEAVVYILWCFQLFFIIASLSKLRVFFLDNLAGKILGFFLISILFFSLGTLYLTEAHINLLCFTLLIYFLALRKNNDWVFGILFSLVFLSRLDNVFPLIFLGLYYIIQRKWDYRVVLKSGFVILILCGSYLLSNIHWFGALVPISGRVKSSFPHIQSPFFIGTISKFFLAINIIALLIFISIKKIRYRNLKIYVSLGSLVQLVYNILFQSQLGQWYYVLQVIVMILILGDLISIILRSKSNNIRLSYALILMGIFVSCTVGYLKMSSNFSLQFVLLDKDSDISRRSEDEVRAFAEDLKNTLPAETRMFTYDFPGKLAFYSGLNIIPADGLVANKAFFDDISSLSFDQYLKKNNIAYINLPSAFRTKGECSFIGISTYTSDKTTYMVKNSLTKKIQDTIDLRHFVKINSYKNPIKTWQKEYDSVTIYKIIR